MVLHVPIDHKDSICMSFVHEALVDTHKYSIDLNHVLTQACIPVELLHVPQMRISVRQYADFWVHLATLMNDEFFGMDQRPLPRGSYQFLAKMVRHSETLKQALKDILTFFNLLFLDFKSQLFIEQSCIAIEIYTHTPKRMFSYATYVMLIHGLMCWLTGQRIMIQQMFVTAAQPPNHHDYQIRFCESIHYHAAVNRIEFPRDCLDLKAKQDLQSWYKFIQESPENLLIRYRNAHSTGQKIRKWLSHTPPQAWQDLPVLAKKLNISEATLQRHLKYEGLSFQQLKNQIRRDLAIELLNDPHIDLHDISLALNFHDQSAFQRAFKKWTGITPGVYRQMYTKTPT